EDAWQSISADFIEFYYPEQGFPEPTGQNTTPWDCEAMFWEDDQLHLFLKDWESEQTAHYSLPHAPGSFEATLISTYDSEGMITGADVKDGVAVFIGYSLDLSNFLLICWDYQEGDYFSGNKRKIDLGFATENGQTEGICFNSEIGGYVSSERFTLGEFVDIPPRLYTFSTAEYITGVEELQVAIDPLFWLDSHTGEVRTAVPELSPVVIRTISGMMVKSTVVNSRMVDISGLHPGVYVFSCLYKGQNYSQQLFIP
ncbi:MAG: hypothetical protein HKN32_04200, partial [Flavobacteriales bacterium]|nr:hypothetical protein [Flavobacteriales bacterium]